MQRRLLEASGIPELSTVCHTPLLRLAREAGDSLHAAIAVALEATAAAQARTPKTGAGAWVGEGGGPGVSAAGDSNGMRTREGWARAELAKLYLTAVTPEHVIT